MDELERIVGELQELAGEASEAGLENESWSCYFELGGVRRITGSILFAQGHVELASNEWLRPSVDDFRKSLEVARTLDTAESAELALKSAFSARTVGMALNDQDVVADFVDVINEIRSRGGFDELIAAQESLESADILNRRDVVRDTASFLKPDDEGAIQQMTDHIMLSTGWPQDRRKHVEEDVRKLARSEQEQDEYCRHLQPLQNLLHTRSPHTAYAGPTKYTCSCTLLGHETRIETEDIETVIDAMKRTYCNNCQQRSPRSAL